MEPSHVQSESAYLPSEDNAESHLHGHQRQPSGVAITRTDMRSRSNTSSSTKGTRRPKSRGSTTSAQSATTPNFPQHSQLPDPASYMQVPAEQQIYNNNPEEMLMRYGQQLTQPNQQFNSIDPNLHPNQAQHFSQQSQAPFEHEYGVHTQGFPQGMPAHGLPHDMSHDLSTSHFSFEGMENHTPTEEELDQSENGKKKKGSASSFANDNELRKLLRQYEGWNLQEMAAEVQRTEGAGGKSERVKQVFAMIWLKETCKKSSGSVRRDRVFSRYAEKCGNERVPTLNPASFGKLVRIIFQNVQTRRLGVRGESKYHYVDLSLVDEKIPENQSFDTSQGYRPSAEQPGDTQSSHGRSASMPQLPQIPTDTAVFPSPSKIFAPRLAPKAESVESPVEDHNSPELNLDCRYLPRSLIFLDFNAIPISLKQHFPETIEAHLTFFTPKDSPSAEKPLELPSIYPFLPDGTDHASADALAALYRTHCICIIDAFRFCKERLFFKHFTSFNGTMTVPVQKLLAHPALAAWIEECDTIMYQKMIAYVAPLTTQMVPKPVLDTFGRISTRLPKHIFDSFEKQPRHVVQAKIIPATRFVHLLSRLPKVNAAAHTAANWLSLADTRNRMWEEFVRIVDPHKLLEDAQIPVDGKMAAQNILQYDMRALLTPLDDQMPQYEAGTFWANAMQPPSSHPNAIFPTNIGDDTSHFLDRWISWLTALPFNFPNHAAKCIINFHNSFWRGILSELGIGGATSFQAWWVVESFLSSMLLWQTEKAGFMSLSASDPTQSNTSQSPAFVLTNGQSNSQSRPQTAKTGDSARTEGSLNETGDKSHGIPDLGQQNQHSHTYDDSGISLGVDDDVDTGKKWKDITASDPADAEGDVIVV